MSTPKITIKRTAAVVFPVIEVKRRIVSHCPSCGDEISSKRSEVEAFVASAVTHLETHEEHRGVAWTRATIVTDITNPQRNRVKLEAPAKG